MQNLLTTEAYLAFKKGNFEEALSLFEKAGEKYGESIFKYNINLCKKLICTNYIPNVSIIIPVYNNSVYIEECIDSVINQTLKKIEIIIINDGSTDPNTNNILKKYAQIDKRIKLIEKENTGYGHSMNVGLKISTGKYIGIVESDDIIDKRMYEILYNNAEKQQAEIVKCCYKEFFGTKDNRIYKNIIVDEREHVYYKIHDPKKYPDLLKAREIVINQPSITLKKFLDKYNIKFNETPGASYQDIGFFWQRYLFATKIYYIKDYLYYLRRDNPGSSHLSKNKIFCSLDEYLKIEKIIKSNNNLKKIFLPLFILKKIGNIQYTLNRIDPSFKIIFLKRVAQEFLIHFQNHEFYRGLVDDKRYNFIKKIICDYLKSKNYCVIFCDKLADGGLEKVASDTSIALNQIGYDVYYILTNPNKITYKINGDIFNTELTYAQIQILKFSKYILFYKFNKLGIKSEFIEYIITNYYYKLIITIHNTRTVANYFEIINYYLNKHNKNIQDLYRVIFVSNDVKFHFELKYGKIKNYNIIYNPYHIYDTDIKIKYSNYLLFAGRKDSIEHKGLDILIDAYLNSNAPKLNIKLLLIGYGNLNNNLNNKINNSIYKDLIIELDFTKNIHSYMKNSICVISPSRWEGFGLTNVESCACGTPVITTPTGVAPEFIINDYNGYLINIGNINECIMAINKIINNKNILRNNCITSVKKFTFNNYINQLNDLLYKNARIENGD